MRFITTILFFLWGASSMLAASEETLRPSLIAYLDLADRISKSSSLEQEKTSDLDELYILGSHFAESYFRFQTEEEFRENELLLFNTISAHSNLRIFFIPLGNALINESQKLIRKQDAEIRHYRIAAGIGGAILGGLAGASYQLVQKTTSKLRLALILGGIAGGASLGYFVIGPLASRLFIDFNLTIKCAEDFMARYPHGNDFIEEAASPELSLALDRLEDDE